eukprot:maker-scaffold_3-snap-gene-11.2-mRNA-1 protein AED:0.00 eAED:0.00 QI:31/1/1/1/1/1/2/58/418
MNKEIVAFLRIEIQKSRKNGQRNRVNILNKAKINISACKTSLTSVQELLKVNGIGEALAFQIDHYIKKKEKTITVALNNDLSKLLLYLSINGNIDVNAPSSLFHSESSVSSLMNTWKKYFTFRSQCVILSSDGIIEATLLLQSLPHWGIKFLEDINPAQPSPSTIPADQDIVLLIDHREKSNFDGSFFFDKLVGKGINVERRNLVLGDFCWIKRTSEGEKVLDVIIERKIASDLIASIFDGRYREQKLRLINCGLKQPMYLLEGQPTWNIENKKSKIFRTAASKITACEINVVYTKDSSDSVEALYHLHCYLKKHGEEFSFEDFKEYNAFKFNQKRGSVENFEEMLISELVQIEGISFKYAATILSQYSFENHKQFVEFLVQNTTSQKYCFEDILPVGGQRRLGKTGAQKIYKFYTTT